MGAMTAGEHQHLGVGGLCPLTSRNSRLQAGPWTWRARSSAATASEQRGHWLNLGLLSHSPSKCSVRPAISTTCEHTAALSLERLSEAGLERPTACSCRTIYLSAFIAASQHWTVFPVMKVQAVFCKGLVLFTTEYAQAGKELNEKYFNE